MSMDKPEYLYHVTDSEKLCSILEHGLEPEFCKEGYVDQKMVYLAFDAGHAIAYNNHHGDWNGKPVLLKIDVTKLDESCLMPDDVDLPDYLNEIDDDRDFSDIEWKESLLLSGQCGYSGVISTDAFEIEKAP